MCELFHDVSQHPDNKMTVKNLAVVFAPIFLQRKDGDLDKGVKETTPAIAVVSFLIENHVSLFKVLLALALNADSLTHPSINRTLALKRVSNRFKATI